MGALDHFLNGLDIMLKAGNRADAEKEAAREERRAARSNNSIKNRSFSAAPTSVAVPKDPSCCLASRKFSK